MSSRMAFQVGDRFGKLVILRQDGVHKKPCGTTERRWLCKCDCGNEVSVLGHNLKSGNTKSCGCLPKQSRLPNNRGVINHIILQYKRHARDRGLAWGLSYEDVERLIKQPCFYCGTINSNHKVTKNCKEGYDHNGIDRTDSSRGYFIDNVVPCCKICNRAKNNMDQREFIEWARKVTNYTVGLPMAEQWGGTNE